jgi:hypothetical protein
LDTIIRDKGKNMKHIIVPFLTFSIAITALGLVFNIPYDTAGSPEELTSLLNQAIEVHLKNIEPLSQTEILRQLDGIGIVCEIKLSSEDAPSYRGVVIKRPSLVSQIETLMKSVCATAGIKTVEGDEWKNSNTKSVLIMTVRLDPSMGQMAKRMQELSGEYRENADKWDVWVTLELVEQYILKRNPKYTVYGCTWSKLETVKSEEARTDSLAIEASQQLLRQFVSDCLASNSGAAAPQERSPEQTKSE